nr:hypothetical protein [Tanacetum cinerariifolium]
MDFRNFMFVEDDEEMSFLQHELSHSFGGGSPSASINDEPLLLEVEPLDSANQYQLVENTPDSRRLARHPANVQSFPDPIMFLVVLKTSWEHIPHYPTIFVGRKDDEEMSFLQHELSPSFGGGSPSASINDEPLLLEVEPLDSANQYQLVENTPDSRVLQFVRIWQLQAVVDNAVNRRARELLKMVDNMKGECEVREKARDKGCEGLKAKCKAAMADFDKNPVVNVLRQKTKSILVGVKEHKSCMDRMFAALEDEKSRLEAVKAQLRKKVKVVKCDRAELVSKVGGCQGPTPKKVKVVKCDRAELVSKVVPYVATELVHSDEMAMLVGNLYPLCAALEEVAKMKNPFNLAKVKGYRLSYKKEHTKVGNNLTAIVFPFLSEVIANPSASVEAFFLRS